MTRRRRRAACDRRDSAGDDERPRAERRENLLIFAKLYGVPKEKRERLIRELLEAVELTQWADSQVKNLSGGMRRRVEIARGLVHEPRIFFLDEPTTGLDPVSREAVWDDARARSRRSATSPC